jgi:hypothetical protein
MIRTFLGLSQTFLSVGCAVGFCFSMAVFRNKLHVALSPRIGRPDLFRGASDIQPTYWSDFLAPTENARVIESREIGHPHRGAGSLYYAFHGFNTETCAFAKSPTLRETIVRLW